METIDAKVIHAIAFAAERHNGQFRKGKEGAPYINHPIQVMEVLIRHGDCDSDLLMAAALHDVIEDTAKNQQEIESLGEEIKKAFGDSVLKLVREVSDDKNLPFRERKRLQVVNTPGITPKAKKIKIADKTCNIMDMMKHPPVEWDVQRKLEYLDWAGQVIDGARGVNPALEGNFDQTWDEAYRQFSDSGKT